MLLDNTLPRGFSARAATIDDVDKITEIVRLYENKLYGRAETTRAAYLAVDSQSLTGATKLYERAGMHVIRQRDRYEKELRAGEELSTQALKE